MTRMLAAIAAALLCASLAHAQITDVLIEVDTGRTEGVFTKKPVVMRAVLAMPEQPTDTALLYFRGYPGISRIESVRDKQPNLQPFMRMNQRRIAKAGIALVVMDCPTDQWAMSGARPIGCFDDYRSSAQHADDVRKVMARLKQEHGLTRIFIMGHSMGSISSRWLAVHLGNEIAGSIHSASMNRAGRDGFARSAREIPYDKITAPVLHVSNENDACEYTRYSFVKVYAGENLLTVRGGVPEGDPCGARHFHSYGGREAEVVTAIIAWIKTGRTERVVGEP